MGKRHWDQWAFEMSRSGTHDWRAADSIMIASAPMMFAPP